MKLIDTRSFYRYCHDSFGNRDTRTLGWSNTDDQAIRFNHLSSIGVREKDSILDVGCGFGDLYFYLKRSFGNIEYSGIEQDEKFYEISVSNLQSENVSLYFTDFLSFTSKNSHDWIFASGVFPFDKENYVESLVDHVNKMFDLCNLGIAFNLLTDSMPDNNRFPGFRYNCPEKIIKQVVIPLSDRFNIIHGYLDGDMTVQIYKR